MRTIRTSGFIPAAARSGPWSADCVARRNGGDGLFLCWRVRHGVFERNRLEDNGQAGISIGHKDSDNLLRDNQVVRNGSCGVLFRDEAAGMSPHRNRLERNSDRRQRPQARRPGHPDPRRARRTRSSRATRSETPATGQQQTQTVGVLIEARVGSVSLDEESDPRRTPVDDRRQSSTGRPGGRHRVAEI